MRHTATRRGTPAAPGDESPGTLGEVLEFMRLIWGVSHGLHATSKRMEADVGITGPQRLVLRIVGRRPGVGAGELARTLQLHPSTLTGILRRLEGRGLVEREPAPRDRRQARLHLTPDGRSVDRRHAGTVEAAVRRVLADSTPARVDATADFLRALESALTTRPTARR